MRDHTSRHRHQSGGVYALIFTAFLAMVAFAGCLDGTPISGDDPEAALLADNEDPWAGDTVRFDGSNSTPPDDSEITHWRFELGDGTVHEAEDLDGAVYEHEYEHGGVFTATLTVTAQDEDGDNRTDTDELTLVVNERHQISETTAANPIEDLPGDTQRTETGFEVYEQATGWLLRLDVENNDPALSSEFTVRILGEDNETLEEERRELGAGENATIELSGSEPPAGNYTFELETESGSVSAKGLIEVLYVESM